MTKCDARIVGNRRLIGGALATDEAQSVWQVDEFAFAQANIDSERYVAADCAFYRPGEVDSVDPTKVKTEVPPGTENPLAQPHLRERSRPTCTGPAERD